MNHHLSSIWCGSTKVQNYANFLLPSHLRSAVYPRQRLTVTANEQLTSVCNLKTTPLSVDCPIKSARIGGPWEATYVSIQSPKLPRKFAQWMGAHFLDWLSTIITFPIEHRSPTSGSNLLACTWKGFKTTTNKSDITFWRQNLYYRCSLRRVKASVARNRLKLVVASLVQNFPLSNDSCGICDTWPTFGNDPFCTSTALLLVGQSAPFRTPPQILGKTLR